MKRILLTGATGFLGSYLADALVSDYQLVLLKRSFSDTTRINHLLGRVKTYDVDRDTLAKIFNEEGPIDIIIHAATAYGRLNCSLSDVITANLLFPVELMEQAIKHKTTCFINTDTFYPKSYDNYSLSKKQLLEWFKKKEQDISVVNMKLQHMYGPADNRTKFIPAVIRKMLGGEKIELTAGEQTRDFIYVDDVVNAFLAVIKMLPNAKGTMLNLDIGTGTEKSLRSLVEEIRRQLGHTGQVIYGAVPYRKDEIMRSKAETTGMDAFGWKPAVRLEDGIRSTIAYEKELLCRTQSK